MNTVVIIEDDREQREMLNLIVSSELGLKTYLYSSAEEFFNSSIKHAGCIYLIDWNLPGIQGPGIIRTIRERDEISPIFMISANFTEESKEKGIEAGADVYLTKPYTPRFLVQNILRAQKRYSAIKKDLLTIGVKLFEESGLVLKDGKPASLTPREFQIFKCLFMDKDKVWKREEFLKLEEESEKIGRKIDVVISTLRKKISEIGLEIETIRGEGYQLREL